MTNQAVEQAFAALHAHKKAIADKHITELFASDPGRFARFHVRLDDLLFDFSKHRLTGPTLDLLLALARAADIETKRQAMFSGAIVNPSEQRPALHTALRELSGRPVVVNGRDVVPDIIAERVKCEAFARHVREGNLRGASGKVLDAVINIGIGGSDLGPAMATRALKPFAKPGLISRFVSNVDGADMADTLDGLDPASTLFIVSSKTFTTQETMANAALARGWISQQLGESAVRHHFAAVSTRLDLVRAFGIAEDRVFGFWDWVGGRYSVWSSIGLPLMIAIGPEHFREFLAGGADIDAHFRTAPFERNIPVLMGLIGVWYRNVWGYGTHAVIPYSQRLSRFPAYLQQLEMESNGKSVRIDGSPVERDTCPVVWGEPGTNGQHAFFQMLHQGTEIVPIDFLVAAQATAADARHHELLFANCLAQGEALMRGRSRAEVEAQLRAAGKSEGEIAALAPHKVFSGNRPSSTILFRALDPRALGRLIALYEHKVFVQAAIWNINPFDQWGVELGKELCSNLVPVIEGKASADGHDSSTAGLVAARRSVMEGSRS